MKALKSLLIVAILGTFFSNSTNAQTARAWEIDKAHTSITFAVDHFFSAVPGKFMDFQGHIHFDPNDLANSGASLTIQVKSIDTDNEKRDKHLLSEDFFEAETYPAISFQSTQIEKKEANEYWVYGKLTIRETTREIRFPMKVKGITDNPWKEGYEVMGILIQTDLSRNEYEVGSGSWVATTVVGDEVGVTVNMELHSPKP